MSDAAEWRIQLEHLAAMAERPYVTVHVLRDSAGLHGLLGHDVWFLLMPDRRTVVYTENGYRGELIEEAAPVCRLQQAYDAVRDLALTPAESQKFILRTMEEVPCDPST